MQVTQVEICLTFKLRTASVRSRHEIRVRFE